MSAARFIPASYSARFVRFFSWWARDKMLARKFFAVRLAKGSRGHLDELSRHAGPVIAATNHVSWWDPLVMISLHRTFFGNRSLRAPMDAAQLERFGFFRRLGTFGIDPDDPASLELMAGYIGEYFERDAAPTLWINPQGRFADVREPVAVRPGVARLAASASGVRVVAVAIEYPFWLDQRPELLLRAEPVEPARAATTTDWLRGIREAMERNRLALAELAIAREPANFEHLIGAGEAKINPIYDVWLRLRGKAGSIDDRRDRLAARARSSA